jgi:hypothetical protein
MCKGDKHGDARRGIIATLSLFQGELLTVDSSLSGLLRIDGLVSCSAYLNRMRAGGLQSAPMGHTHAFERAEARSLLILYQKL